MSDADTAHTTATDPHDEGAAGHGHEPAGEPLGPIDLTGWAYALGGGLVGLLVVVALLVASGG